MKNILGFCLFVFISFFYGYPAFSGSSIAELPKCVVTSHCVLETLNVKDVESTFYEAVDIITNTPRTKIIDQTDSFVHAEAKTKWLRYTDDLLIKKLPAASQIQIRSESRVGIGDNGVNQKRVNRLINRLNTY